jgi:hypothetical protein
MKRFAFLLGFVAAAGVHFGNPQRPLRKWRPDPQPIDPRILRELGAL